MNGMIRMAACAAGLTALTASGLTLENDAMAILFRDGNPGVTGIVSKIDRRVTFGAATGDIDFWQVWFAVPGEYDRRGNFREIERSSRSPATAHRVERNGDETRFIWEGLDLPDAPKGLDVLATVRLEKGTGQSVWTLAVRNRSKTYALTRTRYPVLKRVGRAGEADVLEPRSNLGMGLLRKTGETTEAARHRLKISSYMGYQPMVTAFMQEGSGVYVAAHDPEGRIKRIVLDGQNSAWFETTVENAGVPGRAAEGPKYPVVVDVFRGDWWQAAKKYRAWALASAPWTRKGPIGTRRDYPKAMSETPLWINIHGDSVMATNVLAAARRQYPDFDTGLHWHRWNLWGHDSHYPEYFPYVTNVPQAVASAVAIGQKPMIYTNGRLWDAEIPSWEVAKPIASKRPNGEPYIERYGNRRAQGVMCPAAGFWQDVMLGLTERITGELKAPGLFMDQIGAAGPSPCYNRLHGHPLGGGTYWFDGYQKLLSRAHAVTSARGAFLTTEGTGETWMNVVDGYLCVTRLRGDDVPFYPAVYSDYTTYFCSPLAASDTPAAFWAMEARQVLWGVAPGWFEPDFVLDGHSEAYAEKRKMIGRLCRLRMANLDCLAYGELLDEARLRETLPTATFENGARWTRHAKPITVEMPVVIGNVWRTADGKSRRIFLANVSETPQTVTLANAGFDGRSVTVAPRDVTIVEEKR